MVQKIYIKIPVNRNGFQNPSKIQWSSTKESELWDVISTSKRNEIDWNKLSAKFQVPVTFLQQQTYWMYEKQLEQLRSTIEKGTLSDGSLRNERSEKTLLEEESRTVTGLFDKRDSDDISQSKNTTQLFNSISNENTGNESYSSSSNSTSSSSDDDEGENHGSMLLQRSRILSKVAPKFQDLEEEDDEDDVSHSQLFHDMGTNKVNTESSISNFSSVSITKSALEEALLDTSHIQSNS